jgi:death-on-curing protein
VTEPIWIEKHDALTLHDRLLALYGGAAGLRDDTLLISALARPLQLHAYADAPDIIDMATAYAAGILELNGYRFTASEGEAAQAVLKLASGMLDEAGYATFLRANVKTE